MALGELRPRAKGQWCGHVLLGWSNFLSWESFFSVQSVHELKEVVNEINIDIICIFAQSVFTSEGIHENSTIILMHNLAVLTSSERTP